MLENVKKCEFCGCELDKETMHGFDGVYMCEDCYYENVAVCQDCDELYWIDDLHWLENYDCFVCTHCKNWNYTQCEDCGEWINDNDYNNRYHLAGGGIICNRCFEWGDYHFCAECDELFHVDDLEYNYTDECYYCCDCYENHQGIIHNYYYKPEPIFYCCENEINARYMGVEIEVDKGGENENNARQILDIVNAEHEQIYIKHDGSIDEGFEIVSHPATLEYHLNNIKWDEAFARLVNMGYRSHDTSTCGLHIHISRQALGDNWEEIENTIGKITYFVEYNWGFILKFTRRTESALARWASRYGLENTPAEQIKKVKNDNYSRYRCINLQNNNTVEFRLFRGTLNITTFKATLQFVNLLCEICHNYDNKFIECLGWYDFVNMIDCKKYSELIEYLKNRNLY